MNNSTLRARRAVIELGSIALDVFELPNGAYRLSETQSAEAIGKERTSFRDFKVGKSLEALQCKGFRCEKWAIEGNNVKANLISIEWAVVYWTKEAISGNVNAARLLGACAVESIERRADAAFNKQVEESERNERLAARVKGIEARKSLTDAIKSYIDRHPELSENDKKFLYKNCSDKTNKVVLGNVAKKVAEQLGCDRAELRNHLEVGQIVKLTSLEDLTVRLVEQQDIHPFQAVTEAANRLLLV